MDDDWTVREVACGALGRLGMDVLAAEDGPGALQAVREQGPDLLLLDVRLPGIDGFQVCSDLRAQGGHGELPIILITGLGEGGAVERAYACGATDFVTKPVAWRVLGQRIRYLLRARDRERKLQQSQEQLLEAQQLARVGSWFWSPRDSRLSWSKELCRLLGLDSSRVQPSQSLFLERVPGGDRPRVRELLALVPSEAERLEHRVVRPDGSVRIVRHRVAPSKTGEGGVSGTVQDITHEVELERRLARIQRMEALGTLAAGIVHEISNSAGFVGLNLDLMEEELGALQPFSKHGPPQLSAGADVEAYAQRTVAQVAAAMAANLEHASGGMERIQTILKDLKSYGHPADEEWRWVDVCEQIETALNITRNELKYSCEVVRQYDPLPRVRCQPVRLDQVFINLFINAAHAMQEGGTLTVATEALGDRVRVAVRDTGGGISPDIRKRIFDPFFTTKPQGEGSGLGLHVVRGIVNRHGGDIDVHSEAGVGTTFTLTLPVQPTPSVAEA